MTRSFFWWTRTGLDRTGSGVRPLDVLACCAALAFFAAILIRTAWIADDAFVDFRTAANAASGYGLRWNVVERVETFSDPLWMLLLTAAAATTDNVPLAALALNGILTIGAVLIVMSEAGDTTRAALAIVELALSRAFVDYSVAGLSDALGYLLLAAGLWASCRTPDRIGLLALSAGLLPLVRPSLVLLLAPVLVGAWAVSPRDRRRRALILFAAPSLTWGIFASFYFGLPLPAPFYAVWFQPWSMSAGLAGGVRYLVDSLERDPITLTLTVLALTHALIARTRGAFLAAAGIAIYVASIVASGASAQSGRLLAPALLVAATILVRESWPESSARRLAIAAGLVFIGSVGPYPTFLSHSRFGLQAAAEPGTGIRDERFAAYQKSGLLLAQRYEPYPDLTNLIHRTAAADASEPAVVVTDQIGAAGYAAGPRVTIVDPLGRTDLLTARHLRDRIADPGRASIVPGYVESLRHGTNEIRDPFAAGEYAMLAEVSRAPLLSRARLRAVWKLNVSTVAGLRSNRRRVGRQQT